MWGTHAPGALFSHISHIERPLFNYEDREGPKRLWKKEGEGLAPEEEEESFKIEHVKTSAQCTVMYKTMKVTHSKTFSNITHQDFVIHAVTITLMAQICVQRLLLTLK